MNEACFDWQESRASKAARKTARLSSPALSTRGAKDGSSATSHSFERKARGTRLIGLRGVIQVNLTTKPGNDHYNP